MSDHQRSLEELKASLSLGPAAPDGAEQNAQELRSTLEGLRMEHQLEVENLKAKHKIEAAILIKEREDLGARLQEARDQLGRPETDAAEKLQKAERRLAEMEQLQAEQDRSAGELRERLELSEKKMTDYQALQKAQAESRGEIQRLEEKLRVTANQLQAAQADRYTSHDANVSPAAGRPTCSCCSSPASSPLCVLTGDRGQRNLSREDEDEAEHRRYIYVSSYPEPGVCNLTWLLWCSSLASRKM